MTEQEIKLCLERLATCKTTDVMNFDHAGTLAYIRRLEAENAELKKQLENAVELKAKVGDTLYMPWKYGGDFGIATLQIIEIGIDYCSNKPFYITNLQSDNADYLYKYKYGTFCDKDFDNIIFTERAAAEKRLKTQKR